MDLGHGDPLRRVALGHDKGGQPGLPDPFTEDGRWDPYVGPFPDRSCGM